MLKAPTRILVALDGDDAISDVWKEACTVATRFGSELILVNAPSKPLLFVHASGRDGEDLVDELALTFVPVVIGDGIPLITGAPHDLGFTHRSTTSDPNGFVQVWWERNRS